MTLRKDAPEPLTTAEVAKREGVSTRRIHALYREGRIVGAKKHGNALLIPSDYTILPAPQRPGRKRLAQKG